MARFWKRGTDGSIEHLLRANRPEPTDEFASSILSQVADSPAPGTPGRIGSPRRFALALAVAVVALSIAAVLGGINAASAGLGGIAHIATQAVTPSHSSTTAVSTSSSSKKGDKDDKGGKSDDPDGDADDQGKKGDDDDGDHDGDHHQYKVGVCHWADHKYVLIFTSPQGAANHLKHHPKDKLPVNGHC